MTSGFWSDDFAAKYEAYDNLRANVEKARRELIKICPHLFRDGISAVTSNTFSDGFMCVLCEEAIH